MKKRITALLLCLVMALSLIPSSVWAAEISAEGADSGIATYVKDERTIYVKYYYGGKWYPNDTIGQNTKNWYTGNTIQTSLGKFKLDSNPKTYYSGVPSTSADRYEISDSTNFPVFQEYKPGDTVQPNAHPYMKIYLSGGSSEPEVEKQTVRYQVEYRDANNNI